MKCFATTCCDVPRSPLDGGAHDSALSARNVQLSARRNPIFCVAHVLAGKNHTLLNRRIASHRDQLSVCVRQSPKQATNYCICRNLEYRE